MWDRHLVYHIDKCLGIIPREISGHFDLVVVREDCCDQKGALVCGKGVVDEPFPDWRFAARERAVRLTGYNRRGEHETDGVRVCKTSEASGRE